MIAANVNLVTVRRYECICVCDHLCDKVTVGTTTYRNAMILRAQYVCTVGNSVHIKKSASVTCTLLECKIKVRDHWKMINAEWILLVHEILCIKLSLPCSRSILSTCYRPSDCDNSFAADLSSLLLDMCFKFPRSNLLLKDFNFPHIHWNNKTVEIP